MSTSKIISSSGFTLIIPREQRNFFATIYVRKFFVTRYVQVLFDFSSTKQTQFTVALAFGLQDQTTCSVEYPIKNTGLGTIIQTSLTLKCGVEKPKGPLPQNEEKSGY